MSWRRRSIRALPRSREIVEVRDDSRAVQPGDLFVALTGQAVDGHRFVADAAARGAIGAIVEHPVPLQQNTGGFIQLQVKARRRR